MSQRPAPRRDPHARLRALDGSHPLQAASPRAYVPYPARRRHDGRVAWFNFALAREMGLVPAHHPDVLDAGLERALLDTFCLVIVNEWDVEHGAEVPPADRLPGPYMATRYLQLQHPDRHGRGSGDGRSVWNGCVTHRGVTWDVSSCGTGVTRLCPATASEKRFFRTGNRHASYGCGTAALAEGFSSALMSECFHRNGIRTERVLLVIELPGGLAINVRAAPSLLRPSHFFVHLRCGDLESLDAIAGLYVERRIANGEWPRIRGRARRLRYLAARTALDFARAAATFESEYVFCWLDWDGDNVLVDGSIIDYGSVRQFGLYHREYRFEDVDRFSTSLPEQRLKARHIVQTFAQIRDALLTRRRRPRSAFRHDPVLALFDQEFLRTRRLLLLGKVGLEPALAERVLRHHPGTVCDLERAVRWFERARSSRGPVKVPDGLSWNAIYCVRDVLRELPETWLRSPGGLSADRILEIALSRYASRRDRRPTPWRRARARRLQRAWLAVVDRAAALADLDRATLLARLAPRAARIDRADRITGDAIDHASARLQRARRRLPVRDLHAVLAAFVERQDLVPRPGRRPRRPPLSGPARRLLGSMHRSVAELREGL